ncbi:unnamed protein product [Discula destructiva]
MSHGQPPQGLQNNMFGAYGQMAMPQVINGTVMDNDPDMMMLMENSMFYNTSMGMGLDTQDDAGMASSAFNSNTNPTSPQLGGAGALVQNSGPGSALDVQQYQPSPGDENKPGAGPPPMSSFGLQPASQLTGGSTLTEFTKRRNWPAKCIEELKDLMIILDSHMRVKYVAPSVNDLTGFSAEELHEKVIRDLLHPDDQSVFLTDFNECIASGRTLRLFFRLRKKDGTFAIFESVGHAHIAAARFAPNPNNQSPFCQAVYLMARLYPATNAKLLDSFLEHKMEHERLLRRINELKKEEAEEVEEANMSWRQSQSDITASEGTAMTPLTTATGNAYRNADTAAMPPPERPNPHNSALTRENLESAVTGNRPDSIRDKMARYDRYGGADTIEMLTGLRYNDGERAKGITTGSHSPTLIKGDAGIAIPIDRDPRTGEKKKKQKVAEEYVCTDCGTLDSPEWRKGPSGPKTLCNACGLRWAKREKKKGQSGGGGTSGSGATPIPGSGAIGGVIPLMDQGPG